MKKIENICLGHIKYITEDKYIEIYKILNRKSGLIMYKNLGNLKFKFRIKQRVLCGYFAKNI